MASAKLANVSASLFAVQSPSDRYMDTQKITAVNTAVGNNGALNRCLEVGMRRMLCRNPAGSIIGMRFERIRSASLDSFPTLQSAPAPERGE